LPELLELPPQPPRVMASPMISAIPKSFISNSL
jgi:hypothetical protein